MKPRKISLIVPTLGKREKELIRLFDSLNRQTYDNFEVIVVSQGNHAKVENILSDYSFSNVHLKINRIGLSHARNQGIKRISGEIITFSDDDCWYPDDSLENVNRIFNENHLEIACFKMFDPLKNEFLKNYPDTEINKISKKKILNKSSIEIFINVENLSSDILRFDESFGLGAIFRSGEENILLSDLLKEGYAISYFPETIVYHEKYYGTKQLNPLTFIGKGPLFVRLYNFPMGVLLLFYFYFKKRKFINNDKSLLYNALLQAIRYSYSR